jgi:hypothetical protein
MEGFFHMGLVKRGKLKRLLLSIVVVVLTAFSSVAQARTFTPPGEMKPGEYKYVENSDGTWTEYYDGGGKSPIKGDTYSKAAMEEGDRLYSESAVDEGTTGQSGSIVVGHDGENMFASERVVDDLRTGEPYVNAGEAEVGDEFLGEGISDGTLPTFAELGAAQTGALIAGTALVGVAIGTGIDELMGWPSLLESSTGVSIEPGCNYEYEKKCEWVDIWRTGEVELGEVNKCEYEAWTGGYHKVSIPRYETELCEFPSIPFDYFWKYIETYMGEHEYEGTCSTGIDGGGAFGAAGGIFGTTFDTCGEKGAGEYPTSCPGGDTWVLCFQGFAGPGEDVYAEPQPGYNYAYRELFAPLFETMFPAAFPDSGLKEHEMGVERGTTHTIPAKEPVPEITPPGIATVPPPARQYEQEKAKKKTGEPIIEPEEEGEKVPSPTLPLIPEIQPNEKYETYKEALEKEGFTNIKVNLLPEGDIDTKTGPGDVTDVSPDAGTRAVPSTEVRVDVNPEDAPNPEPPHAPVGGPTLPGIDTPNFGVLCKGFPFGVPCWLIETIEGWSATGVAPELGTETFTIKGHVVTGSKFDLAKLEPIMSKIRPAIVIFVTIGLVLLFYKFAFGGSPPSGGSGEAGGASGGEAEANIYGDKEVDEDGYWKGWH